MRTVGVLLAGCGRYDGSDAQETVALALALERRGFRLLYLAPDVDHGPVFDHTRGEADEAAPARRVLEESARLAGGPVHDLRQVAPSELDALVVPGGAGVVRHLCSEGSGPLGGGPLREGVARLLDDLSGRGAPLAGLGLAQVILARHTGAGLDAGVLAIGPEEVRVDEEHNVLYSPGMMGASSIGAAAVGIERLVDSLALRLGLTGHRGQETTR